MAAKTINDAPSAQAGGFPGVRLADLTVGRITIGTTVAAFVMSYRNQLDFATQHGGYPVWLAALWPLMIDSFVIVGELRLYSAVARHESARIKAWAWLLTLGGLAASMAASVAHVGLGAPAAMKLAAAVPPLAAAASLGTGLGIIKLKARVSPDRKQPAADTSPQRAVVPARRRGKPRAAGQPSYAQLVILAEQDRQAGKPMGRRSFAGRHDLTEHQARTALAGANGQGP